MKKSNPKSAFLVLFVAALIMSFGTGRLAAIAGQISPCDWRYGDVHKMHWPQLPDLGSTGVDVKMSLTSLADDFKCTATGPINDIHIWGSFADDVLPKDGPDSLTFELSIYSDIPAKSADSWSMPGQLLWSRTFRPGQYTVSKVHDGPENWYDPATGLYLPVNHRQAYQYNFCIEDDPFIQQEGRIYWLGVKELGPAQVASNLPSAAENVQSPGGSCGTLNVVGDLTLDSSSVYVWELEATCSDLINVGGNLVLQTGWGLKIETNQPPAIGDYMLFTYGGSLSFGSPVFDVTGAPGWDVSKLSIVDDPTEKKVYLRVGAEPPALSYSFGWKTTTRELRWNDDAVYLVAGAAAAPTWFPMAYPKDHEYANETLDLAFVITGGDKTKGEHDLGDAPDSSNSFPPTPMLAYPATGVVADYPTVYETGSPPYGPIHWEPKAFVYLGKRVSLENEADIGFDEDAHNNLDPPADLPDQDDADDGVQLPLVLPHCQRATLDYVVTIVNSIPGPVYVNVWCDWNRDGDWNDVTECPTGDQAPEWAVQNQQLLFTGAGTFTITTPQFMCWHPSDVAEPPPMWMRITVAEQPWGVIASAAIHGGSGPVGGYQYGETEDYYIYPSKEPGLPPYDWGDAPDPTYPTLAANNGANHIIAGPWLGDRTDSADPDPDGQPSPNALGDDNDGNDDEDGVTIPSLNPGQVANITLEVHGGGGIVQAWIDFDADGTWQASEQIYNGFLPNGTHTISFTVLDSAVIGQTFARFRISRQGGLGPEGPARDGEVEDHEVFIEPLCPNSKWVQLPDVTNRGIDIRVDSSDGNIRTIADDFECRSRSLITDVHLWGSWKDDKKGVIKRIRLSIHPDDSASLAGADPDSRFSKPAPEVLWAKDFLAGQFQEALYHVVRDPGEWWWDPVTGELRPGGDTQIWQIDIDIEPEDAFLQTGTLDDPVIYWLNVQVDTDGGEFGWKTRQWPDHYMDDAVCDVFFGLLPHVWRELRYPKTHPYHSLENNSIDMAFCLTYTEETPEEPTSRPGSLTHCPVLETRCPSVLTRCPPVTTKCPPQLTRCPPSETVCSDFAITECTLRETSCPAVLTECPPTETECSDTAITECPPGETTCPALLTECPIDKTRCPESPTNCPEVPTKCPTPETKCPREPTKCPVRATACPPMKTECPPDETHCPPEETACEPVPTQCEVTECPEDPTTCPAYPTKCEIVPTECPVETECPATVTRCVIIPTQCPVETECPYKRTACPEESTTCPQEPTACPPVRTQCPREVTVCPEDPTSCPPVYTQCPADNPTECPYEPTKCSDTKACVTTPGPPPGIPLGTKAAKSSPVTAHCPAIDVQCPSVVPKHLLAETRGPVAQNTTRKTQL